ESALAEFRAYLEEPVGVAVAAARRTDALLMDGALTAAAATSETVATIARAGPFGAGNPEPVLALPAHTIAYADEVGQAHIRLRLRAGDGVGVNAIAFRSEEHTSELQSLTNLVCRLLLEKKKQEPKNAAYLRRDAAAHP